MMYQFFINVEKLSRIVIYLFQQQIIYSIILFCFIGGISLITRRFSSRWHLGLWSLILIRLVLPPELSHSLSGRYILDRIPAVNVAVHWISNILTSHGIVNQHGITLDGFSVDDPSLNQQEKNTNHKKVITNNSIYNIILFSMWFIGCLTFALIYLGKLIKFHTLIKKSRHVTDPSTIKLINIWRRQFQIKRDIRIVSSDMYLSPFTSGIFRPVIYIPQCVIHQQNMNLIESIIAHEMAHISRYDDLWIKVQNLIQIIYFFHPLVWYANSKINLSRECICDSLVLSTQSITAPTYGKGMMTVLRLNLFGTEGIGLLPTLGSPRKKLRYRIQKIKGVHTMKKYQTIIFYISIILIGIFILPMAKSGIVTKGKITDSTVQAAVIAAENEIKFSLPLKEGNITAKFGKMINPYTKKKYFHKGIDIAAPLGTKIFAAAEGTVVEVVKEYEKDKGPGKYIVLQHTNGYKTRYTHLQYILVSKGQEVNADQVIAAVGNTGISTGPHLHFEILLNEKPVNPLEYLKIDNLKPYKKSEEHK